MKNFICIPVLLSILFASSCEDDDVAERTPKLDYYIQSSDFVNSGFELQSKVVYEYNALEKLDKYIFLTYNSSTGAFEEQHYFKFSYSNDQVNSIKGYLPEMSTPYATYSYQYLEDNRVAKIIETNHATGNNSEVNFMYAENGIVKVSFVYSNREGFEYEFDYSTGNITKDKSTLGSRLCSEGEYTYDQQHNPFKDLGYVDYALTNLSSNNKQSANVNHVGCIFPTFVPESYTYEYNSQGYPVSAITFYKSQGRSKKEFFYK